jgi:hypothetical protein
LFSHTKRLQYNAKPDAPDPVYAKQLQELIGGQWGEMSVTMGYLFQGWNCRGLYSFYPLTFNFLPLETFWAFLARPLRHPGPMGPARRGA